MPVGRVPDSLMDPTKSLLMYLCGLGLELDLSVAWSFGGSSGGFLLLRFLVVLFHTLWISRCHNKMSCGVLISDSS